MRDRYERQVAEGRKAAPGRQCPYGISELGKRCAWLAGHRDRHQQRSETE